jgi:hypothetical protein
LITKIKNKLAKFHGLISAKEPARPTVLIHSDDWGRVGLPNTQALLNIKKKQKTTGASPWDYYGAETLEDLEKLKDTLIKIKDRDGRIPCITANIIMANADLQRMREENFSSFRAVSIKNGFPPPWPKWDIVAQYNRMIEAGVFYPALHGYTHFSPEMMLNAWHDKGELGERARILFENDTPYLASLTPEFNLALFANAVDRLM